MQRNDAYSESTPLKMFDTVLFHFKRTHPTAFLSSQNYLSKYSGKMPSCIPHRWGMVWT